MFEAQLKISDTVERLNGTAKTKLQKAELERAEDVQSKLDKIVFVVRAKIDVQCIRVEQIIKPEVFYILRQINIEIDLFIDQLLCKAEIKSRP